MLYSCLALCVLMLQEHEHPPDATRPGEMRPVPAPLDIPASRFASGTAWQPDSTPMHGVHFAYKEWSVMFHGNGFIGYDWQSTDRGDSDLISTHWLMLMGERSLAGGQVQLRGMFSFERWTVGENGYPLLLQTGEGLQDRQHPHDLFMELAAIYRRSLGRELGWEVYAALAGEPAMGPVAFPHRYSASSDPLGPLSHHWQDSTHISFGVLTGGLYGRTWKVDASWFNGHEPEDSRTDIDFHTLDSYSARVAYNPDKEWSLQMSAGRLDSPEEHQPGIGVRRYTASATWNKPLGGDANFAATAVWGRNDPEKGKATDSLLIEADWNLDGTSTVFGRAEIVVKTGDELGLSPGDERFPVSTLSVGYARMLVSGSKGFTSIGVRGSVSFFDPDLEDEYGDPVGFGFMIFVRVWPARMAPHK